ncbi:uncharacterized protein A4U43_C08F11800 [Asparagus officinalis]|nr:uncharacterized protein A4U43_C08F11800 [Asparagus officinalis]
MGSSLETSRPFHSSPRPGPGMVSGSDQIRPVPDLDSEKTWVSEPNRVRGSGVGSVQLAPSPTLPGQARKMVELEYPCLNLAQARPGPNDQRTNHWTGQPEPGPVRSKQIA